MSLPTGTRIGPYEIVALLGVGGMGEVYRGRDSRLNRDVALKILLPNFAADAERMARFQREAQVLASLNHPHIAALYGLEDAGDVRALVMELVEGPTLDARIKTGPIPIEEALPIAKQIADALEAAHDRGITHRDLKPANVKFTPDGAVKVLDFGLAKALDDRPAPGSDPANSPTLTLGATTAGAILGTAAYMSPEQARGKIVDRRADIWAFGVVLMEMLTGKALYAGDTIPDTLAAVIFKEPSFDMLPAATPASIRKLIRRCLEKDPRRRLQAIGEARLALEETGTDALPETAAQPPGRSLTWKLATAASLACAAVFAFLYFRQTPAPERVLRYSIQAPEKTRIQTFAVSPDGRYLAIAAGEGKPQLWVRPLDALAAQALRGTDDASYPFWSPDSRSIGFFADGKLKRISVEGGPAQTLCDAPSGRGGTWNHDGVIVFAPSGSGLRRVAAVGGVPSGVTQSEVSLAGHRFPEFLPDGRRFLYNAGTSVYVASLDSQPARRVLADASSASWLPAPAGSGNGYLLFARENTLMAQPFDSKTLQPAGDLFPVAEQVSIGPNVGHMQASISGSGVLVYWGGGSRGERQLAWHDRSGKPLGNVGAPTSSLGLALSPDEKTVAAPRGSVGGRNSDIWLHDLARGVDTRFTFDNSANLEPVWSPDGRRLVFSSSHANAPNRNLYLKETSGAGKDEPLLNPGATRRPTDWSSDGKFLLYAEFTQGNGDLWVLNMDGDRKPVPFLQTPFNETQGQFSPDGHWVAYASDESGRHEVYVRPFPSRPGKWQISISGGELPRWRRDGKELFYLSADRKLMSVEVKAGSGAQAGFEAGAPQALFDAPVPGRTPGFNSVPYAVAADGKRFLLETSLGDAVETPLTVVVNWLAAVKK